MNIRESLGRNDNALSILLVEDNLLNQQLTMAMLTEWKHNVHIANNGAEALNMHQNGKFDLILMDLQMPVMDGFDAAKKIRDREAGSAHRAIIVAMTAHSQNGSREKCVSAGMDDYFIKPFTVENFHNFLTKYAIIIHQSGAHRTSFASFDYAAALQQADPIIVSMIADPFLEELPDQLLTMHRSWEKSDLDVFQREAHTLAGLLGSFNARPAQQIAAEIDHSIRSRRFEKVTPLFQRLEDEIELFCRELRWYGSLLAQRIN